ncbi:MAG: hypothetical protein ACT4P1_11005 [Sporichthyaceae bacterium]
MNVPAKLGTFAISVAVAFGLAFGLGSLTDPIAPAEDRVDLAAGDGAAADDGGHSGMAGMGDSAGEAGAPAPSGVVAAVPDELPGLAIAARGYTLRVLDTTPGAGEEVDVSFTVQSPDGGPVLNYLTTHEKEMHFIVVRRDLTDFQHLHPERATDGTWSVPVDLSAGGVYRVFADFAPAALNETITLGSDVFVPGDFTPTELPTASTTWSADGYEVTLDGTPGAGSESELTFTVSRDGVALSDLEPYLGAFGHLVSLRSGDLAYLHTHPVDEATAGQQGGPDILFGTEFPTAGLYRLYLNFSHAGMVRTAEFTLDVPAGTAAPVAPPAGQAPPAQPDPAVAPPAGGHSGH